MNNNPLTKPRKKRKYIRFERKFPNEMWQIDLKVIENEGIWLISIFDDHSRYVLSSIKCMEGTSDRIIYLLKRTIRKYRKPLQILTDHGSQFYNSHSTLQSDFDSFFKEHDIQHVMSGIGKPTTLGKIERWQHTYDVERLRFKRHEQFIKYYNIKRVHMSLNYMTPVQVYNRSVTHVVG
ncbi:MAG: DDE-type integrase/transposase/recombinase [Nitrososphaeraceae archaeon]